MSEQSEQKEKEIVLVIFPGGAVQIDFTSSYEQGIFDGPQPETTGEVLSAVRDAIKRGDTLLGLNGFPVLILSDPLALSYERTDPNVKIGL